MFFSTPFFAFEGQTYTFVVEGEFSTPYQLFVDPNVTPLPGMRPAAGIDDLIAADAPGDALALDPDPTSLKSIPTRSP